MSYPYDPPARRRGGARNRDSRDTYHERIEPTLQEREREVLVKIKAAGERGITSKEIAAQMGVDHNVISGRFTGLRDKHHVICRTGERRNNSAVHVAVQNEIAEQQNLFSKVA